MQPIIKSNYNPNNWLLIGIMDISLRDLAAVCGSNNPLNEELIQKIDQITHTYGVAFDKGKGSLCSEVWHLVATSLEFWTNASVLLSSSQFT